MNTPRAAIIRQHGHLAGILSELPQGAWSFDYVHGHHDAPVSLALPVRLEAYVFEDSPPFLEGLLPEGPQLEAVLPKHKIDRKDFFALLMVVGRDVVGSLTVEELPEAEKGVDYLYRKRLALAPAILDPIIHHLKDAAESWERTISRSFLSASGS